jgi:hypothetical protein
MARTQVVLLPDCSRDPSALRTCTRVAIVKMAAKTRMLRMKTGTRLSFSPTSASSARPECALNRPTRSFVSGNPQDLPHDRRRLRLREIEMAWRLLLTLRQYRALEAGELWVTADLYERIVELCGRPR